MSILFDREYPGAREEEERRELERARELVRRHGGLGRVLDPDHESLVARFDRLQAYLEKLGEYVRDNPVDAAVRGTVMDAMVLARLLRGQVVR